MSPRAEHAARNLAWTTSLLRHEAHHNRNESRRLREQATALLAKATILDREAELFEAELARQEAAEAVPLLPEVGA